MKSKKIFALAATVIFVLAFAGCAPNNEMYISKTAGFWAGLWHGLIIIITFIISLFTDNVGVYELNNNGGWYNFGFVLGILISVGHKGSWKSKDRPCKSDKEKEWEEIGHKVEEKVRTGIQNWLDETDKEEKDWEEIGRKVEEKIKRELRNWAEK